MSLAMTGRSVYEVEGQQAEMAAALRAAGLEPVIPRYADVVKRDLSMLGSCDGLLLDASRPSWGAAVEMLREIWVLPSAVSISRHGEN